MFSIIIPVYNSSKYIVKCLESLLAQKNTDYEIIIVDDGSTDNSIDLIKQIKSNKIRIFSKENGGLSSARNYGIKQAKNEYVWFVDSDDYIEHNSLEILASIINEEKYDIIYFPYYKDYGTKKILMLDENNKDNYNDNILINTSACTKIFKREFYINNAFSFPEGKIYEDLATIPFILSCTKSIKYVDSPLYNYVYRENSIMNSKTFNNNKDDKIFAIKNLYSLFSKSNKDKEYKEQLEYLTIKHLLVVYSSEILPFGRDVYYNRCLDVLKYLKSKNEKWFVNNYLKKASFKSQIYVMLFRHKLFKICKLLITIKNIII